MGFNQAHVCNRTGNPLVLFPERCNDFWDEQGEDEKSYTEKDFEGDEIFPVATGPNFFEGADEESEDERSYDNAQTRSPQIVPKPDSRQAHTKIHGSEGEINQPQIENRGESIPLDGIIIFL